MVSFSWLVVIHWNCLLGMIVLTMLLVLLLFTILVIPCWGSKHWMRWSGLLRKVARYWFMSGLMNRNKGFSLNRIISSLGIYSLNLIPILNRMVIVINRMVIIINRMVIIINRMVIVINRMVIVINRMVIVINRMVIRVDRVIRWLVIARVGVMWFIRDTTMCLRRENWMNCLNRWKRCK